MSAPTLRREHARRWAQLRQAYGDDVYIGYGAQRCGPSWRSFVIAERALRDQYPWDFNAQQEVVDEAVCS